MATPKDFIFQFHKGTIKTLIDAGLNPAFMEF